MELPGVTTLVVLLLLVLFVLVTAIIYPLMRYFNRLEIEL